MGRAKLSIDGLEAEIASPADDRKALAEDEQGGLEVQQDKLTLEPIQPADRLPQAHALDLT